MGKEGWEEHSAESDWEAAAFLPYPGVRSIGEFAGLNGLGWMPAQAGVYWIEGCKTWLGCSRQILDFWRASLREQQDAFLNGFCDQLHRSASEETTDGLAVRRREQA